MKACKDCKHYRKDGHCVSPREDAYTNLVTGEKERYVNFAQTQRSFGLFSALFFGQCGEHARWFEAKDD